MLNSAITGQELYRVRCEGKTWAPYCLAHIPSGSLICVSGKMMLRPRYLAIHQRYIYESLIVVGDTFGQINLIGHLKLKGGASEGPSKQE